MKIQDHWIAKPEGRDKNTSCIFLYHTNFMTMTLLSAHICHFV